MVFNNTVKTCTPIQCFISGILRNRNGLSKLSSGLSKSASTIVKKAVFYSNLKIGSRSSLLDGSSNQTLKKQWAYINLVKL